MPALHPSQTWNWRNIAAIVLVAAYAVTAKCQDDNTGNRIRSPMPEYIQEFFQSDAVRCQEKGEFQLTFATESHDRLGTNVDLQLEYGLTDRLQTSIEVPYGIRARRDEAEIIQGWNFINVGLLYQFIRTDRPFALSAGLIVDFPLRSPGEVGFEPTILLARSFHKLQIHTSVSSEFEQRKPSLAYNISAVYPIKTGWFPTFEFNGRRIENSSFYLTPGVYRRLRHGLEMGVGIRVGVGGMASSLGIVLKTNWELGGANEGEANR